MPQCRFLDPSLLVLFNGSFSRHKSEVRGSNPLVLRIIMSDDKNCWQPQFSQIYSNAFLRSVCAQRTCTHEKKKIYYLFMEFLSYWFDLQYQPISQSNTGQREVCEIFNNEQARVIKTFNTCHNVGISCTSRLNSLLSHYPISAPCTIIFT